MKNRLTIQGRNLLLLTIFVALSFASCKDEKKPKPTDIVAGEQTGFNMNCVIMTRSQVQGWVDSGWTKPEDPNRIRGILFQFYSPDAANADSNMELLAYPGRTYNDVRIEGRINLSVDRNCVPLQLTGKTIFANNVVNLSSLNIFDKEGKLKEFDFIRFRPEKTDGDYISFNIEVVKVVNEKETTLSESDTYPCPPHCPPPSSDEK